MNPLITFDDKSSHCGSGSNSKGHSMLTVSKLCHCGSVEPSIGSYASEFEHVLLSCRPNYNSCRRPIQNHLNIPLWRQLLSEYKDLFECEYLELGFPLDVRGGEVKTNT